MASTIPTPSELVELGRGVLRSRLDPDGAGAIDLEPGSDLDTALSVMATLESRNARHLADRAAARSRSSATGQDLDVVAVEQYYAQRLPATQATGYVYLQRASGGATSIPEGRRFAVPATESQRAVYLEASELTAVASGALKVAVPVRCTEDGAVGNVALADVTQIVDPLPDTSWALYVPTNPDTYYPPENIGGGSDEETDDELQRRLAMGSPDDRRIRGTARAVLVGALTVPGVRFVAVVEPRDGTLLVYAGDPAYVLPSALRTAIEATLEMWRCAGVTVYVRPFVQTIVTVTATLHMEKPAQNYALDVVRAQAVSNVRRYFTIRQRADEYFLDKIRDAIAEAHPETQTVVLASPGADVPRSADAVYGSVTSLTRYIVTDASISITITGPLTQ